jgi:hypothetical protein
LPRKPRVKDHGTPELQAKRLASVVNIYTRKAGDPNMASTELGRLCEQGILDRKPDIARRMYDAGHTVLSIWQSVFPGRGASTLGQFQPSTGGGFDPIMAETDRISIIQYFGPTRSKILSAVIDCCFHDKKQEGGKLEKLRRGLNIVIDWQKAKRG